MEYKLPPMNYNIERKQDEITTFDNNLNLKIYYFTTSLFLIVFSYVNIYSRGVICSPNIENV